MEGHARPTGPGRPGFQGAMFGPIDHQSGIRFGVRAEIDAARGDPDAGTGGGLGGLS